MESDKTATQKVVDNIYEIAKAKEFYIYELEDDMEVSKGYFSRFRGKNPYLHEIPIDKIIRAAEELEVPVKRLLKGVI